jgi:hypothetical protein
MVERSGRAIFDECKNFRHFAIHLHLRELISLCVAQCFRPTCGSNDDVSYCIVFSEVRPSRGWNKSTGPRRNATTTCVLFAVDRDVRPGAGGALILTPLELIDRLAALLRCAGANGRSREISAAPPNGRSWPHCDIHERLITESPRPLAAPATAGS